MTKRVQIGDFADVDASHEAAELVAWMSQQRSASSKRQAELLGVQPGERVLDVGCGPGEDLAVFAAADGVALGVDRSLAMVRSAAPRAPVVVADAADLPTASATFDAAWVRLVLLHVGDPLQVLTEVHRALRPGGRLVAIEPDHGTHVAGPVDVDVFERIRAHRSTRFRNSRIGRGLPGLVDAAGFTDVRAEPLVTAFTDLAAARAAGGPFDRAVTDAITDGAITPKEGATYFADLEAAEARGAFFFAALSVLVRARRP